MNLIKRTRIVSEELLETVRALPCLACASLNPGAARASIEGNRNDAHHVISRGAGGDDVARNVMPACREHHQEWHRVGMHAMAKRYGVIRIWLEETGHLTSE
jgi:hypothetical protein